MKGDVGAGKSSPASDRCTQEMFYAFCCVSAAICSVQRDFLRLPLVRCANCFMMNSKEDIMDTVNTKTLAEHLTALATLLETEAVRLQVLGVEPKRDLGKQARQIRQLAERLWLTEADIHLAGTMMTAVERTTNDRRKAPSVVARNSHLPSRSIKPGAHLPDR
jgi:hypothetical protein